MNKTERQLSELKVSNILISLALLISAIIDSSATLASHGVILLLWTLHVTHFKYYD